MKKKVFWIKKFEVFFTCNFVFNFWSSKTGHRSGSGFTKKPGCGPLSGFSESRNRTRIRAMIATKNTNSMLKFLGPRDLLFNTGQSLFQFTGRRMMYTVASSLLHVRYHIAPYAIPHPPSLQIFGSFEEK